MVWLKNLKLVVWFIIRTRVSNLNFFAQIDQQFRRKKMNFNDSSLLFGFALFRDVSLNLLKFYLTQWTTTCFELLILIRRLLSAKYSLHTNEKLRSQLFILKNSTFQLEWWADGKRTLCKRWAHTEWHLVSACERGTGHTQRAQAQLQSERWTHHMICERYLNAG